MKDFQYLAQLPVIVALAEAASVSRAANMLGLSQPAVSAALAKLRLAFSDPLFERAPRGMSPTPRGTALVATARTMLATLDRERQGGDAWTPAASTQSFTFAMSDAGELVFLPKLMRHLRSVAPYAAVRAVAPSVAEVESGLASGEIDLALGYFPELKSKSTVNQRLFTNAFACVVRKDHPHRSRRISLQQFSALEHAAVRVESRSHEVMERFLVRKRVKRRIALHTPHFMSALAIVAQSDLIVTVPYPLAIYFVGLNANLKIVALDLGAPRIDLKQHWHRNVHLDTRSIWLRKQVADLFAEAIV